MSDNRHRCNTCERRSIAVDRFSGLLVPHRTKAGRKGSYCNGSGKLPSAPVRPAV